MKTSLLVVLGKDKPGIIAKVTGVLYRRKCNLEDISMTVLEDQLAMMMLVSASESAKPAIDKDMKKMVRETGLITFWKDLPKTAKPQKESKDLFIVSAVGRDRTGIVFHISQILAASGLNIQDLNSKILGSGSKRLYAMALEVTLPPKTSIEKIRRKLLSAGRKLKMDISINPVDRLQF